MKTTPIQPLSLLSLGLILLTPLSIPALQAAPDGTSATDTAPVPTAGTEASQSAAAAFHPWLILTDERLDELWAQAQSDPLLEQYVEDCLRQADALLSAPALYYDSGDRDSILEVSRECLKRVYTLGLAYRWSGRRDYYEALRDNLLAVCNFPDWNPSHFLDTAEMTHAVAIGYDWTYFDLDLDEAEVIREALITKGLEPGVEAYSGNSTYGWWVGANHNWNLVCNTGMILGALAVSDDAPQYEAVIVPRAIASMPRALSQYGPDGAWGEGPGYWKYATSYVCYALAALESAKGTDEGLEDTEGLAETAMFPVYSTGPTNLPMAYADCWAGKVLEPAAALFWLGRTYNSAFAVNFQHHLIETSQWVAPEDVIWYASSNQPGSETPALDKYYRGPVELVFMRSAWEDPAALFVGIKAGYNEVNHGHLDLGNFELDALGVRWVSDLGSDRYNLPGYFDSRSGQRWEYYRTNSFSHNVPTFNAQNQETTGRASVTRFQSGADSGQNTMPFVEIDLSNAYGQPVTSLRRGAALVASRQAALVQDEIELAGTADIAWGFTTSAAVTPNGAAATLTKNGKQLNLHVLSPSGATFSVESAEQLPPQLPNNGWRRVMLRLPDQPAGPVRIAVLFSPVWPQGEVTSWPVIPLGDWGYPVQTP